MYYATLSLSFILMKVSKCVSNNSGCNTFFYVNIFSVSDYSGTSTLADFIYNN
jgi:hypothetical protein